MNRGAEAPLESLAPHPRISRLPGQSRADLCPTAIHPHRRELLQMGRMVRSPPPELGQAAVGLRLYQLDARSHLTSRQRREALERIGYNVYIESQNLFRLRGQTASIVGKPDLIGEKYHEIFISDAKTGSPSPSHQAQVRIYQYAVPRTFQHLQGKDTRGQVRYPDSYAGSPASAVNPEFVGNMGALIRRLAADESARRAPSPRNTGSATSARKTAPLGSTSTTCRRGDRRLLKKAAELARTARSGAS